MKTKLMKNTKYLQQKFSRKVFVTKTTADFTSRVSKSYVPFTCKFPMVMNFVPILHKRCRSKTNIYVFSYDKISLKFCVSFRFFLAVFMEKFPKIRYLSYVRRGRYVILHWENGVWKLASIFSLPVFSDSIAQNMQETRFWTKSNNYRKVSQPRIKSNLICNSP